MIDLRSPGLKWRIRGGKRIAYWMCTNPKALEAGYPVKTQRLWTGLEDQELTDAERIMITRECHRLHGEMKDWIKNPNFRRKRRAAGFIYFILNEGLIKIGFATAMAARMSHLQTGSGRKMKLLGTVPGNREIEKFLHWQFRDLHERGEWFRAGDHLREFIERHATMPENMSGTEIRTAAGPRGPETIQSIVNKHEHCDAR